MDKSNLGYVGLLFSLLVSKNRTDRDVLEKGKAQLDEISTSRFDLFLLLRSSLLRFIRHGSLPPHTQVRWYLPRRGYSPPTRLGRTLQLPRSLRLSLVEITDVQYCRTKDGEGEYVGKLRD